jgi:hypothetical protein
MFSPSWAQRTIYVIEIAASLFDFSTPDQRARSAMRRDITFLPLFDTSLPGEARGSEGLGDEHAE